MTLKELFEKRRQLYDKELLKYSRYIFNDHFSLVLLFLIGAGTYTYTNYLESLKSGDFRIRLFLLVLFLIQIMQTTIKTHVEPADQVFLLPKEEEYYPIFKKAIITSYIQSSIITAGLVFISYPILVITREVSVLEGILFYLSLVGLKWLHLLIKLYPYFYQDKRKYQQYLNISRIVTVLSLWLLLFINIKITSILLFMTTVFAFYLFITDRIYYNRMLKWEVLIENEETRKNKIYRLIALFVDVPYNQSVIVRLSFLDRLIGGLSQKYPTANYYYSLRMVIRDQEYLTLIFRLNLIAAFLVLLSPSYVLALLLSFLFIYMLGFQLISVIEVNKNLLHFKIYPISEQEKIRSSLYLVEQLLFLMTVLLGIVATINLSWRGLSFFPIVFIFVKLLTHYYIPSRLAPNPA